MDKEKLAMFGAWMARLCVRPEDFREQFIRSSGKGGQNVNKVATAVQLTHIPTGLSVKCRAERSQAANRITAWTLLLQKIQDRERWERQQRITQAEKLRRQRRGRSRQGKEKMLADKKFLSKKKKDRRTPVDH